MGAIKEKPMTVKVAAMTLINTLINHATELDDRIRLRNFMAALDLMEVVEEVLSLPPQEKIVDEDDDIRMSSISTGLLDDEGRKADPFGRKIAPHLGVMAGPAFTCAFIGGGKMKPRQSTRSLFGGGGSDKPEVTEFWYGLSDEALCWYKYKGGTYTSQRPEGKIDLIEIIDIMGETMNGDLRNFDPATTIWGIDIVCEVREGWSEGREERNDDREEQSELQVECS